MPNYTKKIWLKRHASRSDLTTSLVHLTKETDELNVLEVLLKILDDKKLNGSSTHSGFIIGDNSAVCFQDIPIYGITQNLLHEQQNKEELGDKIRYSPVGLSFSKSFLFNKGARPVIYEKKETAKSLIPRTEWWRIVSFDLSDNDKIIDWTHEREWRLKGDLEFSLDDVTILLTRKNIYQEFIKQCPQPILNEIRGIVTLQNVLF